MKIEKLRKSHKNKIIAGGVIALGVIGTIAILPSFAKYRLTQSINIANGIVNYKVPDFQIVAMYKSDDGENYTENEGRMPDSGYIINEEKSYCNLITGGEDTEAILKTVDGNHVIANLIKGDKCYLYFDREKSPAEKTLASLGLTPSTGTPNFSKTSCTSGCGEATVGIYKTEDGMYGKDSYYWRGNTENNYVKFANFCWRIVRINGDGSIRLIYDGTTCHANGTSTTENLALNNQMYNSSYNSSEYVGYTYTLGNQRPNTPAEGTPSNLKNQTDSWYTTNITNKGYDAKVATGKFCNDRNTASGSTWTTNGSLFYYAAYERLINTKTPTLNCLNNDTYSLKAGAITADEANFAGGKSGYQNTNYYLYNENTYWTMSPYTWSNSYSAVLMIDENGRINYGARGAYSVNILRGVRPVINLLSNTQFKSGTNGTLNNPYEVL